MSDETNAAPKPTGHTFRVRADGTVVDPKPGDPRRMNLSAGGKEKAARHARIAYADHVAAQRKNRG